MLPAAVILFSTGCACSAEEAILTWCALAATQPTVHSKINKRIMKPSRSFILLRAMTSFIFLYAGTKHLLHADKILGRLQKASFYQWWPQSEFFQYSIIASGIVMIAAALLLFLGKLQKPSAIVLLLVLVCITLTIQLEDLNDLGPFFKNVAIAGSLLFIIQNTQYETQKA